MFAHARQDRLARQLQQIALPFYFAVVDLD
jgi:hypothetical protein